MLCKNKALSMRACQTIMPTNFTAGVQTNSQADVDALSHGLTRWARYPVPAGRAQELTTEFALLNVCVQVGATSLQFDEEPSAFMAWLNKSATGV